MNERDDWDELASNWRTDHPDPPALDELRARLGRKRRRLTLAWVGDGVTAGALLAYVGYTLWQEPGAAYRVWAAAVVVFLITALVFVFINRRGLWAPPTQDLESYRRHAYAHCRSRLHSIRFAWGLYTVEVGFVLVFAAWMGLSAGEWWWMVSALGVFTAVLAAWTLWFRRRVNAELHYLRRSFGGEEM